MTTTLRAWFSASAHKSFRRLTGFDLMRYNPCHFYELQRAQLIREVGATCVLDVGANDGKYASEVRACGFDGRIISIEPLSKPYKALSRRAKHDPLWNCVNCAVGDRSTAAVINIARNYASSSLLPMLDLHEAAAPDSVYVGTEMVTIRTLDTAVVEFLRPDDAIWLKIDVQGFERQVLAGAGEVMRRVVAIELELSLVPLYGGQTLYLDMIELASREGFELTSLSPGFTNHKTGRVLQFDGVFFRRPTVREQEPEIEHVVG